jgi:AraC-like DNA-binding protein
MPADYPKIARNRRPPGVAAQLRRGRKSSSAQLCYLGREDRMQNASLMERHRIFRSRDAEETRAFLRGKNYVWDCRRQKTGELDAKLNGIYICNLYIGYVQYGGLPAELSPPPVRNEYWLQFPIRGQLAAAIGPESVDCDPSRGAIASAVRENCRFVSNADSARIQVSLKNDALLGQLGTLLGEPPERPLDFAAALDLTAGHGRSLANHVLMAALDLDRPDSVLMNPATMSMFEQLIMNGLLLSHPHTYSDRLRQLERPIAPRDVKRAIEFIEGNLDAPITLAHLVVVSGVPGRTLFKHFKDSKGTSPMRYLRDARLDKVRDALTRAEPGGSVTAIAMSLGFNHMGRFSVDYRARFGESPSETLRRRRVYGIARKRS